MAIYSWEAACLEAALETNKASMPLRLDTARSGILARLNGTEPIGTEERAEIKNALFRLFTLEQEWC